MNSRVRAVVVSHDEAHDLRRLFNSERSRLLTLAAGVEAAADVADQRGQDERARDLRELVRAATEGRR